MPTTESPYRGNDPERAHQRAMGRAMKLLSLRSRSCLEMTTDLRAKGFPTLVVESTVDELKESGLLDDTDLARGMVTAGQMGSKSRSRIYADLRRRGIDRDAAEEVLQSHFDPGKEREAAADLLRKSLSSAPQPPSETDIARAVRRLSARGFPSYTVANALANIRRENGM